MEVLLRIIPGMAVFTVTPSVLIVTSRFVMVTTFPSYFTFLPVVSEL